MSDLATLDVMVSRVRIDMSSLAAAGSEPFLPEARRVSVDRMNSQFSPTDRFGGAEPTAGLGGSESSVTPLSGGPASRRPRPSLARRRSMARGCTLTPDYLSFCLCVADGELAATDVIPPAIRRCG